LQPMAQDDSSVSINTSNNEPFQAVSEIVIPRYKYVKTKSKKAFVCTALRASLYAHQLKVIIFVPRSSSRPFHYQTPFLNSL